MKYALNEYPCLLNALQDGSLDFSNNRFERQIRRLAKYRNNSFFTGSPEAAKRLTRLLSHFANCKDHHIDSLYIIFVRCVTSHQEYCEGRAC